MEPARTTRRALFWVIGLVVVAALSEGICSMAQPLLERLTVDVDFTPTWRIYERQRTAILSRAREDDTNVVADPDLGWRYRPDYRSTLHNNNSLGLRGTKEYPIRPSPHTVRIAAFGDSFVYGNEVKDDETWPAQLEALTGAEVLNAGVGGYGTDQAYLMYKRSGRDFNARVVLIGFTPVQAARNVNVYRRFLATQDIMFVKPRYLLSPSGDLELLPPPVRSREDYWRYYENPAAIIELGKHDFWYKRLVYEDPLYDYSATVRVLSQTLSLLHRKFLSGDAVVRFGRLNPKSEAFKITVKLLQSFANEVRTNGSVPVIVLLPAADRLGADGREPVDAYAALTSRLRDLDLEFIDLAPAFDRPVTRARHFMAGGHYSPHSNLVVAKAIAAYLSARGLLPQGVQHAADARRAPVGH